MDIEGRRQSDRIVDRRGEKISSEESDFLSRILGDLYEGLNPDSETNVQNQRDYADRKSKLTRAEKRARAVSELAKTLADVNWKGQPNPKTEADYRNLLSPEKDQSQLSDDDDPDWSATSDLDDPAWADALENGTLPAWGNYGPQTGLFSTGPQIDGLSLPASMEGYEGNWSEPFRAGQESFDSNFAAEMANNDPIANFARDMSVARPGYSQLAADLANANIAESLDPFGAFTRDMNFNATPTGDLTDVVAPEVASDFDPGDLDTGFGGDWGSTGMGIAANTASPGFAERYGPSLMSQGLSFGDTPVGSMPGAPMGPMVNAGFVDGALNGARGAKRASSIADLARALANAPSDVTNTAAKTDMAPSPPAPMADSSDAVASAMGAYGSPETFSNTTFDAAGQMMSPTANDSLFGAEVAQSTPDLASALMGAGEEGADMGLPERNPLTTQPGLRDYISDFKGSVRRVGPMAKAAKAAVQQDPTAENMVAMTDVFGKYSNVNGKPSKAARANRAAQLSAFASKNSELARALAGRLQGGMGTDAIASPSGYTGLGGPAIVGGGQPMGFGAAPAGGPPSGLGGGLSGPPGLDGYSGLAGPSIVGGGGGGMMGSGAAPPGGPPSGVPGSTPGGSGYSGLSGPSVVGQGGGGTVMGAGAAPPGGPPSGSSPQAAGAAAAASAAAAGASPEAAARAGAEAAARAGADTTGYGGLGFGGYGI